MPLGRLSRLGPGLALGLRGSSGVPPGRNTDQGWRCPPCLSPRHAPPSDAELRDERDRRVQQPVPVFPQIRALAAGCLRGKAEREAGVMSKRRASLMERFGGTRVGLSHVSSVCLLGKGRVPVTNLTGAHLVQPIVQVKWELAGERGINKHNGIPRCAGERGLRLGPGAPSLTLCRSLRSPLRPGAPPLVCRSPRSPPRARSNTSRHPEPGSRHCYPKSSRVYLEAQPVPAACQAAASKAGHGLLVRYPATGSTRLHQAQRPATAPAQCPATTPRPTRQAFLAFPLDPSPTPARKATRIDAPR